MGKLAEANKAQMNEILRSDNFKKTTNNFYRINNTKNQRNESMGGLLKVVERSDEYHQPSKEVYDMEAKHVSPVIRGKVGLLKAKFDMHRDISRSAKGIVEDSPYTQKKPMFPSMVVEAQSP